MMNRKVWAFVLALGFLAANAVSADEAGNREAALNAETFAYACGGKKLQFTKKGALKIFSGERELGTVDFNIWTPTGWFGTGWSEPFSEKGKKFKGNRMHVTDIQAEGGKIVISGKVPWQKKGEPVVIGDWQIKAEPCKEKGKIKIEWSYEVPPANKYKDEAVFMVIKNCKMVNAGPAGKWDPATPSGTQNYLHAEKDTVITMEGAQAGDDYRIQSSKWRIQTQRLRFMGNKDAKVQAVFDLSEVPAGK